MSYKATHAEAWPSDVHIGYERQPMFDSSLQGHYFFLCVFSAQQTKCFEPCKPVIKHPKFRRTLKWALNKRIRECAEKADSFTKKLAAIQQPKKKKKTIS